MTESNQWVIDQLPYEYPFLFVDDIMEIRDDYVKGSYTFNEDLPFYKGHFKNNPITPGVLLIECMAQIGLVCLGIFLLKDKLTDNLQIGMTSSNAEFYIPVMPNEKLIVESSKVFFRFNKLKCQCKLFNSDNKLVAKAEISGMLKS